MAVLLVHPQEGHSTSFQARQVEEIDPATISRFLIDKTNAWADAWASRKVNRYINYYAPNFKPERGDYEQWKATRRQRVSQATNLTIQVREIQVVPSFDQPDIAETSFIQHYQASHYKEISKKVLTWQLQKSGVWMIIRERNYPLEDARQSSAHQRKRS